MRKPTQKPSDSYGKRFENQWQTIRFLWERLEKLAVNHQIPIREREETTQKPSDSYGKRLDN